MVARQRPLHKANKAIKGVEFMLERCWHDNIHNSCYQFVDEAEVSIGPPLCPPYPCPMRGPDPFALEFGQPAVCPNIQQSKSCQIIQKAHHFFFFFNMFTNMCHNPKCWKFAFSGENWLYHMIQRVMLAICTCLWLAFVTIRILLR